MTPARGTSATLSTKARAKDPRWDGIARHGRTDRPFWEAVQTELKKRYPAEADLKAAKADRAVVTEVVNVVQGFEDIVQGLPVEVRDHPTGVSTHGNAKIERKVTLTYPDADARVALLTAVAANDMEIAVIMSDLRASVPAAGVAAGGNTTFEVVIRREEGEF